jgi:hypothetical protein
MSARISGFSFGQLRKAPLPMLVTLAGIVMDSRVSLPPKALSPMVVRPAGIVTDFRLPSKNPPLKAYEAITVVPAGMV